MPQPVPPGVVGGLDLPLDGSLVEIGRVEVSGWAMYDGVPVLAIAVTLAGPGWTMTRLADRYERPDVAALFGRSEDDQGVLGWTSAFDLSQLSEDCPIVACATLWGAAEQAPVMLPPREFRARPSTEACGSTVPEIMAGIELPAPGESGTHRDLLRIRGWALARGASIDDVEIFVGGASIGRARLGMHRPDVFEALELTEALLCGFEHHTDLARVPSLVDSVTVGALVRAGARTLRLDDQEVRLAPPRRPRHPHQARRSRLVAMRTEQLLERLAERLGDASGAADDLNLLVVTHDLGYGGGQLWLSELLDKSGAGRTFPCTVLSKAGGPLTEVLERAGMTVHVRDDSALRDAELYEYQVCELAIWSRLLGHNAVLVNTAGSFLGADLAARLGLPCVWAIHESWTPEEFWKLNFAPSAVDPDLVTVARRTLARVPAVVFEAEATRRLYEGAVMNAASLVIPYGIDIARVDSYAARVSVSAARRQLAISEDVEVVLMLGTIEPRKAQTVLAQAFERVAGDHPKALLALVGDQNTDYSRALRRYVDERGLRERVRLVPVLEDIYPWYRAADLFVCASDVESMPRSLLEAMAFGTAAVSTDVFGIRELIEHDRTGWLFAPRSVREAARALDRALSVDSATRASIGQAGREVVRRRHDSVGYSTEIVALLRKMIASPEVDATHHVEAIRSAGDDVLNGEAVGTCGDASTPEIGGQAGSGPDETQPARHQAIDAAATEPSAHA